MKLEKYTDEDIEFALQFICHPEQLDQTEVMEWLNDEGHRVLLKGLWRLREGAFSGMECLNVDGEWKSFRRRRATARRHFPRRWMSGAAAAVVMLLSTFAWIYLHQGGENASSGIKQLAEGKYPEVTITTGEGEKEISPIGLLQLDESAKAEHVFTDSIRGVSYLNIKGDSSLQKKYHTLRVARGGEYFIQFADGTKAWLNSETELRYPVVFENHSREVELLNGEVYFEVSRDEERPFVVIANRLTTRVLGTEFNVQSYPGKPTNVTLVQGSVAVRESKEGAEELLLKPGENACLKESDELKIEEVDVQSYIAWKDGFFYYNNVRLEEMLDELGDWYDFSVFYENPGVKDYRLKFWVSRKEHPEKMAERLNELGSLNVRWKNNCLIVSDK